MTRGLYNEVVVKKPWGFEYLVFESEEMALWLLHIQANKATSLHCHPKKTTGFLLLAGQARVDFVADSKVIEAPAKEMFRRGLFHRTTALSADGVWILEAENPNDKADLVRLADGHGRGARGYEGPSELQARDGSEITIDLDRPAGFRVRHPSFGFDVELVDNLAYFSTVDSADFLMFLTGGFGKTVDGRRHLATVAGDVGRADVIWNVAENMEFVDPSTHVLRVAGS